MLMIVIDHGMNSDHQLLEVKSTHLGYHELFMVELVNGSCVSGIYAQQLRTIKHAAGFHRSVAGSLVMFGLLVRSIRSVTVFSMSDVGWIKPTTPAG